LALRGGSGGFGFLRKANTRAKHEYEAESLDAGAKSHWVSLMANCLSGWVISPQSFCRSV
jgi:hypothetical protein